MKSFPKECPKLRPFDVIGDLMTVDEWLENVKSGLFIDYDGFGDLAAAAGQSSCQICPSDVDKGAKIPAWATHVVWYNR